MERMSWINNISELDISSRIIATSDYCTNKNIHLKLHHNVSLLGHGALKEIGLRLSQPITCGQDWHHLADKLGFSQDSINLLERKGVPGYELLNDWRLKSESTIAKLEQKLYEIDRKDVLEILYQYTEGSFQLPIQIVNGSPVHVFLVVTSNDKSLRDLVGEMLGVLKSCYRLSDLEITEPDNVRWDTKAKDLKGDVLTIRDKSQDKSFANTSLSHQDLFNIDPSLNDLNCPQNASSSNSCIPLSRSESCTDNTQVVTGVFDGDQTAVKYRVDRQISPVTIQNDLGTASVQSLDANDLGNDLCSIETNKRDSLNKTAYKLRPTRSLERPDISMSTISSNNEILTISSNSELPESMSPISSKSCSTTSFNNEILSIPTSPSDSQISMTTLSSNAVGFYPTDTKDGNLLPTTVTGIHRNRSTGEEPQRPSDLSFQSVGPRSVPATPESSGMLLPTIPDLSTLLMPSIPRQRPLVHRNSEPYMKNHSTVPPSVTAPDYDSSSSDDSVETQYIITNIPGWHPHLREENVMQFMSKYRKESGCYIIWNLDIHNLTRGISVTHVNKTIKNYRIYHRTTRDGTRQFYIYKEGFRASRIIDLIDHYKTHDILNERSRDIHVRLLKPIPCGRTCTRNWHRSLSIQQ